MHGLSIFNENGSNIPVHKYTIYVLYSRSAAMMVGALRRDFFRLTEPVSACHESCFASKWKANNCFTTDYSALATIITFNTAILQVTTSTTCFDWIKNEVRGMEHQFSKRTTSNKSIKVNSHGAHNFKQIGSGHKMTQTVGSCGWEQAKQDFSKFLKADCVHQNSLSIVKHLHSTLNDCI